MKINKIKNKDTQSVDNFIPVIHKEIVCVKCGMGNVYCTAMCWNCKEPLIINKSKEK